MVFGLNWKWKKNITAIEYNVLGKLLMLVYVQVGFWIAQYLKNGKTASVAINLYFFIMKVTISLIFIHKIIYI